MQHITMTHFGPRPLSPALVKLTTLSKTPGPLDKVDKWQLFRDLCVARADFGVSNRELTVLNALLSFHPGKELCDDAALIVFPSNASLAERAHGLAESTLRRHLASLVSAGLVRRQDSPNGKRYAARNRTGQIVSAFGFDLRPLLVQARRIALAADNAREVLTRQKHLREEISLLKRDAFKLLDYAKQVSINMDWAETESDLVNIHRITRRKIDIPMQENMIAALRLIIARIAGSLSEISSLPSGKDVQNERHIQSSNKELFDSEEAQTAPASSRGSETDQQHINKEERLTCLDNMPLSVIVEACPDIKYYAPDKIENWSSLHRLSDFLHGMMGISSEVWHEAKRSMGLHAASVTLICILQRMSVIKSPGGYLRSLSRKASVGLFSPIGMVLALSRSQEAKS